MDENVMNEQQIDLSQFEYLYIEISKPDLSLDLDSLHQEMTLLSTLVLDYGELLAAVKGEQGDYRSFFCNELRNKDQKISETKVKASLEEDKIYNQFQKNIDKLKAILDALYAHREMLKKLTDLWVNEYWHSSKDLKGSFKQRGDIITRRAQNKAKEKERNNTVEQQRQKLNG